MKKIAWAALLAAFTVTATAQQVYGTWNRFRTLTLNTTAAGANIQGGAVTNFPLLVRLSPTSLATGANILSEALANGADIRFTDSTGTVALPYQIDSWASTGAAIWVKLPTVPANGIAKVRLYWNKAGAADSSTSASVFDTSAGFTGAWHLEQGIVGTGGVLDATGNALHFNGNANVNSVPGIIGRARHYNASEDNGQFWVDNFTGTANLAKAEKFRANGTSTKLTITTWVNPQINSSADIQGIFGHYRYGSTNRSYMLAMGAGGTVRINTSITGGTPDRVVESGSTPLDSLGKWRHIMMTIDSGAANTQIKIWVDGQRIQMPNHATEGIYRVPVANDNARPFIGAMETSYNHRFQGFIDELQFSNGIARDSNWAKLSYQTQKANVTALTFGATESPTPRTLFYPLKFASYKRNDAIINNVPVLTGTATGYTLTNLAGTTVQLPAGLTFASNGTISGAPTVVQASTQYVVTANLQGGGTGKDTLSIAVTPGDAPGAPGTPSAVAAGALGSGQATITWTVPPSIGSSAIIGYKVTAFQDTSKTCSTTTALSCTVSDLGSGSFNFQVRAINSDGAGPRSEVSNLLVPPAVPGPSPAVSAAVGSAIGSITVYWSGAPTGGSPILSYKVTAVEDTSKWCGLVMPQTNLQCNVHGLTGGQAYTFQVRAINAVGAGNRSTIISSAIVAPTTGTAINPGSQVIRVSGSSRPFTFALPQGASADQMTLVINDVWGRTVWSKSLVPTTRNRELTWNGKNMNGRPVAAGMYVVKIMLLANGKQLEVSEKAFTLKP